MNAIVQKKKKLQNAIMRYKKRYEIIKTTKNIKYTNNMKQVNNIAAAIT